MAGDMDDKPVDPATEREIKDTMDEAIEDMRNEGMVSLAKYVRNNYVTFRKAGFNRKNSFTLTVILFQNLLAHG